MTEQGIVDRPAVDADDAAAESTPDPSEAPLVDVPSSGGSELTPGGILTRRQVVPFEVHLDVFSGPFDLLLGLISKHKLDITEVALAQVTDEFISHIKAAQATDDDWDLGQASEFLLVAATLLDLKAARLLPSFGPQDDEDLALIEARDLLFARLLQYRAYKQIASAFRERMATAGRITPRQAGMEPEFASLLPELVIAVTPEQFAMIAARAMIPKVAPTVGLDHLHAPQVSVREQAAIIVERLRTRGQVSFRSLVVRRRQHPRHRRPLPGPARALQGVGHRLRAGRGARRARHPLDGQRARRRGDRRRVRRGRRQRRRRQR